MTGIQWEPVDTLFFRDGTPFSAGSASQEDVGGLFPPHPASVAGAFRAALARLNGWTGVGRWPRELDDTLGDGPDDLGAISLVGPFLLRDGQPLFPVPRHVLGSAEAGRWQPRVCLRPGSPIACDLGDGVRLPEVPPGNCSPDDLKAADGWWVSRAGWRPLSDARCQNQPLSSRVEIYGTRSAASALSGTTRRGRHRRACSTALATFVRRAG